MLTRDFDYELPPELVAQHPLPQRSASRLLYIPAQDTELFEDKIFSELPSLLRAGDLLVFNDSRVFPARLYGRKTSGGQIEILIERLLGTHRALAHIRASKSPKPGSRLILPEEVQAEVLARRDDLFELEFHCMEPLLSYLQRAGQIPLPPYIARVPDAADHDRYQTVFARAPGAVAAPTAGLHFEQPLFDALKKRGIDWVYVTLHVGAGTFRPVRAEKIQEHRMHSEYVEVSADVCQRIKETAARGGRVVAVGTTVVRSLEAAAADGELKPFTGETRLFITPGYRFRTIDMLITNFHLPRSSLLMLVSAFGGYERIMQAYRHAVRLRYRFFSYGDAMLLHNAGRS
ncbi:MAG TPA: tRNA preQ1(34) S-adenosylmethionine ribosyltransferase-isomerase QueA [Gammaproteobacteria bacterium]|nr:tRNA preQ1(34) S-adenosylmethionine ribosyltransferase-isomerase QueA [Gammaproteobacteria bacterium]